MRQLETDNLGRVCDGSLALGVVLLVDVQPEPLASQVGGIVGSQVAHLPILLADLLLRHQVSPVLAEDVVRQGEFGQALDSGLPAQVQPHLPQNRLQD